MHRTGRGRWASIVGRGVLASLAVAGVLSAEGWDLDEVYPDAAAWSAEVEVVREALADVAAARSELAATTPTEAGLARLLTAVSTARGRAGRLAKVGLLQAEIDQGAVEARRRREEGIRLEQEVEAAVAFLPDTVAAVDEAALRRWIDDSPALAPHRRRLRRLLALAPYRPDPGSADVRDLLRRHKSELNDLYGSLLAADLAWPTVELEGAPTRLDPATAARLARSGDDATRRRSQELYYGHLEGYESLFAPLLLGRIDADRRIALAHGLDEASDALLVLTDGLAPGSRGALIAGVRAERGRVATILETLRRARGLGRLRFEDLASQPPPGGPAVPLERAQENAVAAASRLGDDAAATMRRILAEPWFHLAASERKAGGGGVFWQVGGGHPHGFLTYRESYAGSRTLSGAALLAMAYAAVPEEAPPDAREEDFPIFGNVVWYLGRLLHDDAVAKSAAPQARREILAYAVSQSVLGLVRNALFAELEAGLEAELAAGRTPSGSEITERTGRLIAESFGDDLASRPAVARSWISQGTLFYGSHHAAWAQATAAALLLRARIEAGDETARRVAREGMGRSPAHLSQDVLLEAGLDLSDEATYREALVELEALAGRLETEPSTPSR